MPARIPQKLKDLRDVSDAQSSILLGISGTNTGDQPLATRVTEELAAAPRKLWWVFGDSSDGGTTPNATVQSSIDALLAAGVPSDNIRWLYESEGNTFIISDLTSQSTIENITLTLAGGTFSISDITSTSTVENITLTLAGGTFAISDLTSQPTIENIVLVNADTFEFVIADITSQPTIENIVLVLAGGTLAVSDITSTPTIESFVLTLAGGTFAISDLTSQPTIENIVLEEAAPPSQEDLSTFESGTNGWTYTAGAGTTPNSGGRSVSDPTNAYVGN